MWLNRHEASRHKTRTSRGASHKLILELWCDSRAYVTQGCGGTPLGARVMGDKTGAAASEAMMTVEERVQGADDGEVTMKSEGAGSVPDVH